MSETGLAIATARLNSRLCHQGVSSRELWTQQRTQFTNDQLPLSDHQYILSQHKHRTDNHPYSEQAKNSRGVVPSKSPLQVGELVYLVSDRDKSRARDRSMVHGATSRNLQVLNFVLHRTKSNYLNATPSLLLLLPPTIQTTTMKTGSTIAASRQTPTKNSLIPFHSSPYDHTTPHAPNLYHCKTTTIRRFLYKITNLLPLHMCPNKPLVLPNPTTSIPQHDHSVITNHLSILTTIYCVKATHRKCK